MNLITEIDLLQAKIKNNIENNEAEKLYYQTLALKELNGLNMGVSDGDNLELLTPEIINNTTQGITSSAMFQSANPFGLHSHTSYGWMNSLTGWTIFDFQANPDTANQVAIHKYLFTTQWADNYYLPHSWTLEVLVNDTDWQIINEQNNVGLSCRQTIIRIIQNPVTCSKAKLKITAAKRIGTSASILGFGNLSYYGKKIT